MTRRLISILVTSLLLISGGARAQTPPANTGTTGAVDANWQVSLNGGTTWFQAFKVINPLFPASGFIPPNWEPNTAAYSWISATPTGTLGTGPESYLFRTFFSLTGFNPATANLSFLCAVDNLPATGQYSLNGGTFVGTCGHQSLYHFTGTQTLASGFNGGSNELVFHVTGDGVTDGVLVGCMAVTAACGREPGSGGRLAAGLVGVVGAAARRRRKR